MERPKPRLIKAHPAIDAEAKPYLKVGEDLLPITIHHDTANLPNNKQMLIAVYEWVGEKVVSLDAGELKPGQGFGEVILWRKEAAK